MRLITIGSDRKLFKDGSDVTRRALEQSKLLESHLIIVFARRSLRLSPRMIGDRVKVVPTNSRSRFLYVIDAVRVGLREGRGSALITTQDPFEAGLAGMLLKRRLRIPLQVQIHTDFLSPRFRELSLLNRIRLVIASMIIPGADCLRVVSRRIKDSVEKRYGRRVISVLPVYARPEEPSRVPYEAPFERYILVAARLEREKDVESALRAFAIAAPSLPNVGLLIAGDGSRREGLKTLATRLSVASRVAFLGWRDDLPALMRGASAFLATSRFEGYGVALLEAARLGCPVISTDVGIIGEVIPRESVTIVPIGDPRGIALGLTASLAEGGRRDRDASVKQLQEHVRSASQGPLDEYLRALSDTWALCRGTSSRG